VSSDFGRHVLLGLCAAAAVACFDPLYGEGDALSQTWVICCSSGVVNTCLCDDPRSCAGRFVACAGGTCSSGSCEGPQDAGELLDAGSSSDAGILDAGSLDGGAPLDAGSLDAGSPDAGAVDAGAPADTYEFCCRDGHLTTCVCPRGACVARPFTPCASSTCIKGAGQCP
jgi:hypothetical protein